MEGTIEQQNKGTDLKYLISINTISEPLNACPDIIENTSIFNESIDKSYSYLNDYPDILRNKLQPLEKYSGKKFQLCIKISNSETDNTKSTLVNMTIFNEQPQ